MLVAFPGSGLRPGVLRAVCALVIVLTEVRWCAADEYLYEAGEVSGYLKIERFPDLSISPTRRDNVTVQTSRGPKELTYLCSGDCDVVLYHLLRHTFDPDLARLVVETKDHSKYGILIDPEFEPTRATVEEVVDKLGLEMVHGQRRKLFYAMRLNDQQRSGLRRFNGQPEWPEAAGIKVLEVPKFTYGTLVPCALKRFSNGGVVFFRRGYDDDRSVVKDHNLYFDGVSFNDLAQFFEEVERIPVVNQTNDRSRYSFVLPDHIWKRFNFHASVPLPELGVSVSLDEAEIDALIVRDKQVGVAFREMPTGRATVLHQDENHFRFACRRFRLPQHSCSPRLRARFAIFSRRK